MPPKNDGGRIVRNSTAILLGAVTIAVAVVLSSTGGLTINPQLTAALVADGLVLITPLVGIWLGSQLLRWLLQAIEARRARKQAAAE